MKDHYIFYCEGRLPGKLFGVGKLMGEVSRRPQVLCLVSASSSHAWHWGLGSSWCCAQSAAQEMCEIQREKGLKLHGPGAFVAVGDLSTQEWSPPLEPANATSRDVSQGSGQRECLGRGLYGR